MIYFKFSQDITKMRFIPLVSAIALAFSFSAAQAQSWYVGGSLAGTMLQDVDSRYTDEDTVVSSFDTGYGLSGHVGAAFDGFRVEGELSWSKIDVNKMTLTGVETGLDGDLSVLAGMVNGYYDLDTGGPWKPYLGAGIGYAKVSMDFSQKSGEKLVDDSDNVFAYQAMVGVGYEVSASTTIYGGYKYFATEDASIIDSSGGSSLNEFRIHKIEVGVRFAIN